MSTRATTLILMLSLTVMPSLGCGKKAAPTTSGDVAGVMARKPPVDPTLLAEADAAFDRRFEQTSSDAAIAGYEAAILGDPGATRTDRQPILVRLSVLYYGRGYHFEREADKKVRMESYWKGRDVAMQALSERNPAWKAALDGGAKIPDSVHLLTLEDAPALFWAASNWSRWGEMKGILRVALDIPKVKAANERVLALAEDYYGGGVHRFFGAYFVAIPPFAGKDAEKGKAHFDRAVELAPQHWETQVMYADYYARDVGDRALFERLLQGVIGATLDPASTYYFEDLVAQDDAKRLLAKIDSLFP